MFTISKAYHWEVKWCSAHQLTHLEEGHKCSRMHGHNYKLVIFLQSQELNKDGFVIDFGKLQVIKDFIMQNWDHRNLSEILHPQYATSEVIAKFLYDKYKPQFPQIKAIEIWETDSSCTRYEE
jgi:6-pyruvoyltetrahydropterin/6-carboxytetrahydropterin synthase